MAQGCFTAKITEAGTLAEVVGERMSDIDSLIVEGPMAQADIDTIWSAGLLRNLTYLNLENAQLENNKIPDNAFYRPEVQFGPVYVPGLGWVNGWQTLNLTEIVFPNTLEEIGRYAFAFVNLKDLKLPNSLRKLDKSAFASCRELSPDTLAIPEGVEEIPERCFEYCYGLREKTVKLPSTIKRIESAAFYTTQISHINFPEGLESIAGVAFAGCLLKEIILPEGLKRIEECTFEDCGSTEKIYLPSTLEYIDHVNFQGIGRELNDGDYAIYSASPVPPEINDDYGNGLKGTSNTIPIYIPKGSLDAYMNAPVWNRFYNYIETDDFPTGIKAVTTGGVNVSGRNGSVVIEGGAAQRYAVYAIDGRAVADGVTSGTRTEIPVPAGVYIVKAGGTTVKIAVR